MTRKHYNIHSDDSVDVDEGNSHGNGDDYDSMTTIREVLKNWDFFGIFPKLVDAPPSVHLGIQMSLLAKNMMMMMMMMKRKRDGGI